MYVLAAAVVAEVIDKYAYVNMPMLTCLIIAISDLFKVILYANYISI